jgi:hypothetical protein
VSPVRELLTVNGGRLRRQWFLALTVSMALAPFAFGVQRAEAAPEDERVRASDVLVGLRGLEGIAAEIAAAAATDKAKAEKLIEDIEPAWEKIEGTIRANDKDAYVRFEDSFGVLEQAAQSGDGKKAFDAAAAIATAAKDYLAAYPPGSDEGPTAPTPPEPGAAESATPEPVSAPPPAATAPPEVRAGVAAGSGPGPSASEARAAASVPRAALPRTGPRRPSGALALAGAALGVGGLAVIGGAGVRRRGGSPHLSVRGPATFVTTV